MSGKQIQGKLHGYLIEFDDGHDLFHACEVVRDAGYRDWDAHTPFPVHGLNTAMGLKPSKLPYIVFFAGLTGLGLAVLMQWWMNAVDYPYIISGKPFFSLPANIPIIFELTILLSAFAAFFGMMGINGLPRFHHPVFFSKHIHKATDDRFFISILSTDPLFSVEKTRSLLESLGGLRIEELIEPTEESREEGYE
jgi:hypothetical protein